MRRAMDRVRVAMLRAQFSRGYCAWRRSAVLQCEAGTTPKSDSEKEAATSGDDGEAPSALAGEGNKKSALQLMRMMTSKKIWDGKSTDYSATLPELLWRLPHFGHGMRIVRKKWLIQNLYDTYITLDQVWFTLDNELRQADKPRIRGFLTWRGEVLDPPHFPRDVDWRAIRGEWKLWYPGIIADFQESRRKLRNVPDDFPMHIYIPDYMVKE